MSRRARLHEPGIVHHATAHGVNDEFIFRTPEDRAGYLAMLAATVRRYAWRCLAFCEMGTHVHLLIEPTLPNFSDGMRWFHGHYGRCFNKQHGRSGHLFQGRYHDRPVLKEAHLFNAVGYIATNPVEAGICRDPLDWEWSSHARISRGIATPWLAHDRLLQLLGSERGEGVYEQIVAARYRLVTGR